MHKYLLLGKSGQLASSFRDFFIENKIPFECLGKEDVDANSENWKSEIISKDFSGLINCMAYTVVDKAETDKDAAENLNVYFPRELAKICKDKSAIFVHYSTDYVFNESDSSITLDEHSKGNPVNYYGRTKWEGDQEVSKVLQSFFIFRTSWVFSPYGNNFVKTILRLANERESLRVVNDQYGLPTSARDLAEFSFRVFSKKGAEYGIYNLSNSGVTHWAEFAEAIVRLGAERGLCKIIPVVGIPSEEYPTAASRPKYNVFNLRKIQGVLNQEIPSWESSLKLVLDKLAEIEVVNKR